MSEAKELPIPVFGEQDYPEDIRLKYRFLDLRRDEMHENIILRSKVISTIRTEMIKMGFLEYQTPILTSSSPEEREIFLFQVDLIKVSFMLYLKLHNNLNN